MTAWGISADNHPTAHGLAIDQRADRLGLDVMWVGEHLFSPRDYDRKHPYRPHADPPMVAASNDFSDTARWW